ncbi:MAG: transcription elongation factor GreB [Rhodospirillaceae bacterium]|jgi:transcription elongation factor GreB|nr:transcription elongation factor GreB [Rhodospirillaceae bacterium]MBT5374474.1 transcription elongation factor GreB [Rhodospirillaceae bacterium]MBT5659953.1 transcription elongation factor GreB [Rhodospirillaceae bacterium]MBT5751263.1 transcription elongation factor GreB [Rhodospirillaceae bacterium]
MSKAFTKESENDGDDDLPEAPEPLPPGVKNYITPEGLACLQAEFRQLMRVERPKVVETVSWAAGNGDRSENGDYIYGKKRLREIDRRLRFLQKRLDIAEMVDPARQTNRDQIFFGATVTYADGKGRERTIRIVGVDEIGSDERNISWISPLGRVLLKAGEGDVLKMSAPGGIDEIEVLKISYEDG